jgi:hypothetical protein
LAERWVVIPEVVDSNSTGRPKQQRGLRSSLISTHVCIVIEKIERTKAQFKVWLFRKLDVVSRAEHEKQVKQVGLLTSEVALKEREIERKAAAEIEYRHGLQNILPKLVKLALVNDPMREQYRLVTEFSPYLIREAFMWGNDDFHLRVIGEELGIRIYRELKTFNVQRFGSVPNRSLFDPLTPSMFR